jgi:hypothetical protein
MTITLQKNGVKNFSMASHTQTIWGTSQVIKNTKGRDKLSTYRYLSRSASFKVSRRSTPSVIYCNQPTNNFVTVRKTGTSC